MSDYPNAFSEYVKEIQDDLTYTQIEFDKEEVDQVLKASKKIMNKKGKGNGALKV